MTDISTTELSDLKQRLWACAEVLRGSAVDRTDWKAYILPLVFFKRICDVWDEETAEATETYGDADSSEFPEIHRFAVPDGCHWRDVRATPSNVGEALARSMREIERSNPDRLFRVFGAADWGNKEILGDELLKNLIEELSAVSLGNTAVSSDILGDAYEYLVGQFADVTRRKKAGEFYTPRGVIKLMTQLLDPQEGETIYDPACGTGGMLLGAIEHVEHNGGDPRTFYGKIFGQEKNLNTSSIARMNLVLHGVEDFEIAREDTLRSPAFTDPTSGGLATFDCVIANPPFSLKEWGREEWESDPWGRNTTGTPPASYGDYAWLQHMVASMAEKNGRLAVVLPQGALFRKGAEGKIRRQLLEADLIETVIGLADNLFYGTSLSPAILVLRATKPVDRRNKVLVVDASELFRKGRAQNFFDPEHVEEVATWVSEFTSVEHKVSVVELADIEAEDWTLNISRFVQQPIEDVPPLEEALADFRQAIQDAKAAEDNLRAVLAGTGLIQ
jgi:type I restriction enzyme M protein